MRSLPAPERDKSKHPVDVGERTEAIVICELIRRGYCVLTPRGFNHRYDLVLDCRGRFVRVQCKTGRLRDGVILFATRSIRSNMRRVHARGYAGEVDMFMVYCPDTDKVYAVPAEHAQGTGGRMRVEPTGNGQVRGVRWAADFELSRLERLD